MTDIKRRAENTCFRNYIEASVEYLIQSRPSDGHVRGWDWKKDQYCENLKMKNFTLCLKVSLVMEKKLHIAVCQV